MSIITVDNLSKRYRIGRQGRGWDSGLRHALTGILQNPFKRQKAELDETEFWALKDVSFEVQEGEVLGIIGRNGAGKSTLLKILSRITWPTSGEVRMRGRVASLLEVGTGFHPELTGRENIYLNGSILGMTRAEVKKKFDEIVDFSEIEKFLDTPVKRYSSGMYVRLAFAVAAHLEPEILLVDEVLAVGDAGFQKKCLGKMGDVAKGGRTVLFVSHNMTAVSTLCNSSIWINDGTIWSHDKTKFVVNEYLKSLTAQPSFHIAECQDRQGNGQLRFENIMVVNKSGKKQTVVSCGDPLTIRLDYQGNAILKEIVVTIGIYNINRTCVAYLGNHLVGETFRNISQKGTITCSFDKFPLLPGQYSINVHCVANGILADYVTEALYIQVVTGNFFATGMLPPDGFGLVAIDHSWRLQ